MPRLFYFLLLFHHCCSKGRFSNLFPTLGGGKQFSFGMDAFFSSHFFPAFTLLAISLKEWIFNNVSIDDLSNVPISQETAWYFPSFMVFKNIWQFDSDGMDCNKEMSVTVFGRLTCRVWRPMAVILGKDNSANAPRCIV